MSRTSDETKGRAHWASKNTFRSATRTSVARSTERCVKRNSLNIPRGARNGGLEQNNPGHPLGDVILEYPYISLCHITVNDPAYKDRNCYGRKSITPDGRGVVTHHNDECNEDTHGGSTKKSEISMRTESRKTKSNKMKIAKLRAGESYEMCVMYPKQSNSE
jgi:hypothetical protein